MTHLQHGPPHLRDGRPYCNRSLLRRRGRRLLGRSHKRQQRTSTRVKGQGMLRPLMMPCGQGMLRHLMMRPHHRPPRAHPDKAAQALGRRLPEWKRVGGRREMHIKTAATAHVQQQVAAADAQLRHLCRRPPTPARTKIATTVSTHLSGRPSLHASTPPATRPFVKTVTRATSTPPPTLVGKMMPVAQIGSVPSAPGVFSLPLPPALP